MCYRLVERYSVCRCVYYEHSIDMCAAANQQGHRIQEKTILVGYLLWLRQPRLPPPLAASPPQMMGPVFRSRRGRLALLPPRAVRAQSLGRLPLLLPSSTLQRAALGPDALVCPAPRAGFYAVVMSVAGVSTVGWMVRWMAYFFAARVLLSEVLLWMAPPPGSPTTEDIHGMLRIETKHVRDETQNNAHE
ncbi:hypothetical protein VE01_07086 [Pseudogymnoascus verrucosus]|uniref:Uncharacterized protein n=1 Tax=Pseudogymnoascus verrucosus TaxID=342668 RepID=A0A1B8GE06_9PEZI|nr:uncharacterized protein VE01_07086 [Pseudogymnoascus verrucosus]OBT94070.1 hypothetical protein VE01_07086 [Pseudogymnoascus verrucosus]